MKQLKTLIITSALCVIALFVFCFFRTVPVSRLWKGYQVLYVLGSKAEDRDLAAVITANGCKDVVTRQNQRIPIVSTFSPVQVQDVRSYLTRRNAFFTDESKQAAVFYVPEGQDAALARAIRALSDEPGVSVGTDGTASFPWLSPIICAVFALVCLFFAKNKGVYLSAAVFLVLFSFSRPLLTACAAVCLALYGFFMLQKIWGRQGFRRASCVPLVVLCLFVPVLLLFVTSPMSALFYALSVVAAFSAMMLVDMLKNLYDERYVHSRFVPVLIRSARTIPLVERKEVKIILALVGAVVLLLGISVMGASMQHVSLDTSKPALPAPLGGRSDLPDLDDFMAWSWNTITFPYRRMTDSVPAVPVDGDTVSLPVFDDADGHIVQGEQTVYVFNGAFRNSVYDSVKNLSYPALEKMLLKQGKDARYSYVKSGGASSERFGTVLLLLFMLIPAGIIGYFVVIRRHYGISL